MFDRAHLYYIHLGRLISAYYIAMGYLHFWKLVIF